MSAGKVFVDTNILIYAYDRSAGVKHEVAADLVSGLWKSRNGMLSTQVLQEFYVNVTRKIPFPLEIAVARMIIEDLSTWDVAIVETDTILAAIDLQQAYCLSFWDSLILVTAEKGGAVEIITEDLNHGQVIGGVSIRNPFISS